jgi:hypothetical protein
MHEDSASFAFDVIIKYLEVQSCTQRQLLGALLLGPGGPSI